MFTVHYTDGKRVSTWCKCLTSSKVYRRPLGAPYNILYQLHIQYIGHFLKAHLKALKQLFIVQLTKTYQSFQEDISGNFISQMFSINNLKLFKFSFEHFLVTASQPQRRS